ncbi:hypothetical protein EW146_g4667 [Bondarzewia mesenterica]|uniref:FAS1 domain-containing protein n=1 Tax=Bondarzewia mesenterica TaxID=1095465 RepID=A0A4S4LTV0_9AGAM|nr:hypothetical protein EW146_g4667 [Bondarzewia mesenterica]
MLLSTLTFCSAGLAAFALPGSLSVFHSEQLHEIIDGASGGRLAAQWAFDVLDKIISPPKHPQSPLPSESEDKSIYDILSDDPDFSRLVKLINFTDDVEDVLKDTSTKGEDARDLSEFPALIPSDLSHDLVRAMQAVEELDRTEQLDDDDDHKKHRKEVLKKIVRAVLLYHVLPEGFDSKSLAINATHGTKLSLSDESLNGQPLRLRVASGPPIWHGTLIVNFYAKIVKADVSAKNGTFRSFIVIYLSLLTIFSPGVIHVINHPLFPPPSIFQEIFNFPDIFSISTSALQRVHLTSGVDWRFVPKAGEKGSLKGNPALTLFVPSNSAWKRLPEKLRFFLFSPFGERVLHKLLAYHIVPDFVLHSDYAYNVTSDSEVFMEHVLLDESEHGHHEHPAPPRHEKPGKPDFPRVPPNHEPHHGFPKPEMPRGPPQRDEPTDGPHMPHPEPPHVPHPPADGHHPSHPHGGHELYAFNLTLPTLLPNNSLHIHVTKRVYKFPIPGPHHPRSYVTHFVVNDQFVALADVPARNGAFHVISKVLNPCKRSPSPHDKDAWKDDLENEAEDWEDWEEWLPAWAEED